MTSAAVSGISIAWAELSTYVVLWIILTFILLCGMACLWSVGLQVDFNSMWIFAKSIILYTALAWIFRIISHSSYERHIIHRIVLTLQDLFFSAAQMIMLGAASELFIYLAAHAGAKFPMRDNSLEYLDSMLNFNWHVMSNWIYNHSTLDNILLKIYNFLNLQIILIFLFISSIYPGRRNKEFIVLFMISIIVTIIIFTFVPVFGMFGKADPYTFDRLLDIRSGSSIMNYNCTAAIINFPSYHTVLAILIPYSARHRC